MQQSEAQPDAPDVFHQLGSITRQLHEALKELGYTEQLKGTVDQLPDAQSRLNYIARLTGEAANKVLTEVEGAKQDQALMADRGRQLLATIGAVPGLARAMPELLTWSQEVVDSSDRCDARLTEIMMAQDFHDLTGQVIARVVRLAETIEEQLLSLLLQAAPSGKPGQDQVLELGGPVVDPKGRHDVVVDQKQVDDLLASLGF